MPDLRESANRTVILSLGGSVSGHLWQHSIIWNYSSRIRRLTNLRRQLPHEKHPLWTEKYWLNFLVNLSKFRTTSNDIELAPVLKSIENEREPDRRSMSHAEWELYWRVFTSVVNMYLRLWWSLLLQESWLSKTNRKLYIEMQSIHSYRES